jgi:hypothetical protein
MSGVPLKDTTVLAGGAKKIKVGAKVLFSSWALLTVRQVRQVLCILPATAKSTQQHERARGRGSQATGTDRELDDPHDIDRRGTDHSTNPQDHRKKRGEYRAQPDPASSPQRLSTVSACLTPQTKQRSDFLWLSHSGGPSLRQKANAIRCALGRFAQAGHRRDRPCRAEPPNGRAAPRSRRPRHHLPWLDAWDTLAATRRGLWLELTGSHVAF